MNSTTTLRRENDILQETATRLINALGVETAIYICRSNYWHGVMQLILDREAGSTSGPSADLHELPVASGQADHQASKVQELAIAA